MRVTVIGCSGSFAGPESPASSYLVQHEADGRTWNLLLDLGSGALGALQRHLSPDDLDAVVLSHLHPDHCVDLCGLYVTRRYRPAGTLPHRLPVFGPVGTAERVALMYHGLEPGGMEAQFAFGVVADAVPLTVGPFTVTPYAVNHPVEAYGYRVEAGGAVLAFTGDTDDCDEPHPAAARRRPRAARLGVRRRARRRARHPPVRVARGRGRRAGRGRAPVRAHPHPRLERPAGVPRAGRCRVAGRGRARRGRRGLRALTRPTSGRGPGPG